MKKNDSLTRIEHKQPVCDLALTGDVKYLLNPKSISSFRKDVLITSSDVVDKTLCDSYHKSRLGICVFRCDIGEVKKVALLSDEEFEKTGYPLAKRHQFAHLNAWELRNVVEVPAVILKRLTSKAETQVDKGIVSVKRSDFTTSNDIKTWLTGGTFGILAIISGFLLGLFALIENICQ